MGAYHWEECSRNSSRYNPPLEARYSVVLKRVKRVRRILEVGSGDGYLMNLVRSRCDRVIGVDFEMTGLRLASKKLVRFRECSLIQGNCYDLPFRDESFDLVLLSDVIEHLEDPEVCLREIARVLRPEGMVIVTTPKSRSDRKWDERHFREYQPEELRFCLERYFFEITLSFFWPKFWSRIYETKYGWHLLKILARYFPNPFLREGLNPEKYGQMIATCRRGDRK